MFERIGWALDLDMHAPRSRGVLSCTFEVGRFSCNIHQEKWKTLQNLTVKPRFLVYFIWYHRHIVEFMKSHSPVWGLKLLLMQDNIENPLLGSQRVAIIDAINHHLNILSILIFAEGYQVNYGDRA
jgi:hypothetical protein